MNIKNNMNSFLYNIYLKLILLFLVFHFITGYRFKYFDKLFYFDILMIIYVFSTSLLFKRKVSEFTFNFIKIMFIILLPSIILINFVNDISSSLTFFVQYLFLIIVLPLFLESVHKTNLYDFMLKALFFGLIINSILFLMKFTNIFGDLYFSTEFKYRFALGELTPNEMGHYLVLGLFLITLFIKNKMKYIFEMVIIIPYFLTLSKTVWVQILVYIIKSRKNFFAISLLIMCILYFNNYLSDYETIITHLLEDFSTNTSSNEGRLKMMKNALDSLPYTIMSPGFHSVNNLNTSLSVHNGVLSYIVNFGLISFLLLILISSYFIFKNIQNKYFRFILFFIFIDSITLLFNPVINSRIVWFPLFIYIYTYHYKKDEYV